MQKFKVLIADDHALIRDGVKNLIGNNQELAVVAEAKTGAETLDQFERFNPDLIILDISMPDKNGMEVSREILTRDPSTRIIVLSMYDDEDYISRCLEYGVKGYVVKSESGAELDYAIRAVLEGKHYFSQQAQHVIFGKYSRTLNRKKHHEEAVVLTKREIEIIRFISEGFTSLEIAHKLFISPRTVETHRANVMKKIGVKNAIELVKKVQQLDLIKDDV